MKDAALIAMGAVVLILGHAIGMAYQQRVYMNDATQFAIDYSHYGGIGGDGVPLVIVDGRDGGIMFGGARFEILRREGRWPGLPDSYYPADIDE